MLFIQLMYKHIIGNFTSVNSDIILKLSHRKNDATFTLERTKSKENKTI